MRKSLIFTLFSISLLALSVTNCSYLKFPGVYRVDIPQGNLIEQDKVDQVEIGMEPRQVRYLLGTPLITDTFNQNRWDYYYSIHTNNKTTIEHHLRIVFTNGRVTEIKDQLKN